MERHEELLERLTGQQIVPSQFNDNRLSSLLSRLSQQEHWEGFEAALWRHSVEVYELESPSLGELHSAHVDSTTACGHDTPQPEGLMQFGQSKDHRPDLAQLKLMTLAVYPHSHLQATQVTSGQTADDPLDLPIMARAREMFGRIGVLDLQRLSHGYAGELTTGSTGTSKVFPPVFPAVILSCSLMPKTL